MKKSTKLGLTLAAVGIGVGAWAYTKRQAIASAATVGCRPTPLQLDAFGKLQGFAIVIMGTGEKLGAHLEGVPQFQFVPQRGILQQTGGSKIYSDADVTAQLCAYIQSPAGSPFNANAITRYKMPQSPLAAPKQAP